MLAASAFLYSIVVGRVERTNAMVHGVTANPLASALAASMTQTEIPKVG
jgi:hypothetical protein